MKLMVLVVEDDRDYGERFLHHLSCLGARGFLAETFYDALKILRTRPEFDAVIADVMVPKRNGGDPSSAGIEFVKKVKSENGDIPTFLYSSNFSTKELDKLKTDGICDRYASRDQLDGNEGKDRFEFVKELLAVAQIFGQKREEIGANYREEMQKSGLDALKYTNDETISDAIDESLKIELLQSQDFEGIYPDDEMSELSLRRPIPIWLVRRAENLYSAEVYRVNSIRAFGEDVVEARENLARTLKQAIHYVQNPGLTVNGATGLSKEDIDFLRSFIKLAR